MPATSDATGRTSTATAGRYDPFAPGPAEVAVRTIQIADPKRDRTLPVEVWSPVGVDTAPLVVYSHSSYGGRREAAGLLGHLASRGFVAAAPDHVGNLATDSGRPRPQGESFDDRVRAMIAPRVPDLRAVIDALLERSTEDGHPAIDASRIATIGWSFGGWAALAVPEVDDRVAAVVAMVPAGATNPLPGIIPAQLTFAWHRQVPALVLAAERDQFTPLDRVAEVFARAPEPKRGFVLLGADHEQFADEPSMDPIPREAAHAFRDALTLAHLEASLGGGTAAGEWLDRDAPVELRARGVGIEALTEADRSPA